MRLFPNVFDLNISDLKPVVLAGQRSKNYIIYESREQQSELSGKTACWLLTVQNFCSHFLIARKLIFWRKNQISSFLKTQKFTSLKRQQLRSEGDKGTEAHLLIIDGRMGTISKDSWHHKSIVEFFRSSK